MQEDFHYYATYYAAREARFEKKEAETIAFSANYVDHNNYDRTKKKPLAFQVGGRKRTHIFEPTTTSGYNDAKEITVKHGTHRRVWTPFHFLPGNYIHPRRHEQYNDLREMPAYRKSEKRKRVLTRPYSWMAINMINDTVKKRRKQKWNAHILNLIGIRMHVFADTWAHQDFAGKISAGLNDFKKSTSIHDVADATMKEIHLLNLTEMLTKTGGHPEILGQAHSPRTGRGVAYLGHGRLGFLPDLPWLAYAYWPSWANGYMVRNNPLEFFQAFVNMVEAFKCIKNGSEYKPIQPPSSEAEMKIPSMRATKWEMLQEEYSNIVRALLWDPGKEVGDRWYGDRALEQRCAYWKRLIRRKGWEIPADYDKDLFLKNSRILGTKRGEKKGPYTSGTGFQYSQYCRFNVAAFEHFKFVRDNMQKPIFDFEARQKIQWKIKNADLYNIMRDKVANVTEEEYMYNDIKNTLKSIIVNTGVPDKREAVRGSMNKIKQIQAYRRDRNRIIQQYYDEIQRLASNNMLMLRSRGGVNQESRAVKMVQELKARLEVLKSEVKRFEVRLPV